MRRKCTEGRIAIGVLIAFAFWIFVILPIYYGPRDNSAAQQCSAKENENYSFWEKARCDPIAYFTVWLVGFTGVLALSTIGLWIVTWRASDKQSRDMRASIRVSERTLTELETPFISIKITDTGTLKRSAEIGHDFQNIWFCIANYGRTPARLIELVDKFSLLEINSGLPPEVSPDSATRNPMPHGVIAPPEGESQPFSNNLFHFMMNYLVADRLPLQTKDLFFYGFVRYSTIFDEIFRVGFCYRFDRYSEKWLLSGNEKYNYCCKESGPPATQ